MDEPAYLAVDVLNCILKLDILVLMLRLENTIVLVEELAMHEILFTKLLLSQNMQLDTEVGLN